MYFPHSTTQSEVKTMSDKEKQSVLETFKNLPRDVQLGVIAGKTLADLEQPKNIQSQNDGAK